MAIPYVKQTWADASAGGTPVSAARLGALEQGIFDAHYQPAVRVTHNTTQSVTSSVALALAFNTERYDQASNTADTMHDNVTNNSRLTCRYAGVYKITGHFQFASSAAGSFRLADIRVNGTTTIARMGVPPMNTTGNGITVTTDYALAVNDYVELLANQDSGGALNVLSTANYSPEFMMVRVG